DSPERIRYTVKPAPQLRFGNSATFPRNPDSMSFVALRRPFASTLSAVLVAACAAWGLSLAFAPRLAAEPPLPLPLPPQARPGKTRPAAAAPRTPAPNASTRTTATLNTATQEPRFATRTERGYWLLLNKPYLPADFDQQTFDDVWKVWEEPTRSTAEKATPDERRKLAFARYGLLERANDPQHRPLQYIVRDGQWSMNCFACHQGSLDGRVIPGLANARYDMQTLYEDVPIRNSAPAKR
ncbi:MAG: hypothetical protein QM811_04910, partial [Pirellulales bacterium]